MCCHSVSIWINIYTIFINNDFFRINGIDPKDIAFCEYAVANEELEEIILRLADAWEEKEFRLARLNRAATDFLLYLCENLRDEVEKKKRQEKIEVLQEKITSNKINKEEKNNLYEELKLY